MTPIISITGVTLLIHMTDSSDTASNAANNNKKSTKDYKTTRDWCFTQFAQIENFLGIFEESNYCPTRGVIRFVIVQKELCPKTGRLHLQGFMQLYFSRDLFELLRDIPELVGAHCEPRRRTVAHAIDYCCKEETRVEGTVPFIYGVPVSQGQRTDLEHCRYLLQRHMSILPCFENHFGTTARYHRGFRLYIRELLLSKPRLHRTHLTILLGPPNTGKSTWVRCNYNTDEVYYLDPPHTWWSGYRPRRHKIVVFDEFAGQVSPTMLNRLSDTGPVSVNPKCTEMIPFLATELIVISNISPLDWWNNTRVPIESLLRRIDRVIFFEEPTIQRPLGNNFHCTKNFLCFDEKLDDDYSEIKSALTDHKYNIPYYAFS